MDILFLVIGALLGFGVGWFLQKSNKTSDSPNENSSDTEELKTKAFEFEKQLSVAQDREKHLLNDFETQRSHFDKEKNELKEELQLERAKTLELSTSLEKSRTYFKTQEEKIQELQNVREEFEKQFEGISAKLIKQNTEHLASVNNQKLNETLKPLGERIKSFEEKIERSDKDRSTLKGELNKLFELNQQMATEAQNLTTALKGDSKQQGNWGELILERILESSGLESGREYETQYSTTGEEGNRLQPDVIINLPDEKHIIVDSKVSLVAYEEFVNATDEDKQLAAAKQHILSIKTHIKGLSEKNYQLANGINSPDFTLLFMPIEPAFSMALQTEPDLFTFAWDKKIVIVSPTTLLATLRTIASIWKQEKQTQNAMKIAEEGGKLHDKFKGFLDDMQNIGLRIEQTNKAYDSAMNKLSTGPGNVIKKADDLRKLGAKTSKQIDAKLLEEKE